MTPACAGRSTRARTADEVLEFLRRHSSTPLPQALEYLVADVARRHGRLRVGGATTYLRGDPAMVAGAVRSAAGGGWGCASWPRAWP